MSTKVKAFQRKGRMTTWKVMITPAMITTIVSPSPARLSPKCCNDLSPSFSSCLAWPRDLTEWRSRTSRDKLKSLSISSIFIRNKRGRSCPPPISIYLEDIPEQQTQYELFITNPVRLSLFFLCTTYIHFYCFLWQRITFFIHPLFSLFLVQIYVLCWNFFYKKKEPVLPNLTVIYHFATCVFIFMLHCTNLSFFLSKKAIKLPFTSSFLFFIHPPVTTQFMVYYIAMCACVF